MLVMPALVTPVFVTPVYALTAEDAFSPRGGATDLIISTIGDAHKTIRVAAYAFTSKPIAEALVAAHDRGVAVQVVLDMKANLRQGVGPYVATHGVPIRLNGHYAILHDKFMVIDDKTLELGSFNYTASAEKRNAENVLVLHDVGTLAADYTREWQRLWDEGQPLLTAASYP